jgi:hypothetical protein
MPEQQGAVPPDRGKDARAAEDRAREGEEAADIASGIACTANDLMAQDDDYLKESTLKTYLDTAARIKMRHSPRMVPYRRRQ